MQHVAATWPQAPKALILVGDGTSDPHNYTGRNNANHMPPSLALVDPWLGETACEPCFGQLDGNDPRDDALPDLAVGRLPVKTEAELAALVQKLIGYDTAAAGGSWRGKAVFVADNADGAGDVASVAELSVFLAAGREVMFIRPRARSGSIGSRTWYTPRAGRDSR